MGDHRGLIWPLNGLAALHRDTGRHARALELAQDARSLAEDTGERRLEAEALNTLASIHQRLARHQQAIHGHEQALRLARDIEARYPEAQALVGLAVAHRHAGQPDRASSYAGIAISLTRRAGRVLEGQALAAAAAVHLDQDEFDLALHRGRQAATLYRETGHRLGEARSLLVLGHALRHASRTDVRRTRLVGSQATLWPDWRYHAFVTDRDGDTVSLDADHRRHAVIELAIRDLKHGAGLRHCPSGKFLANAAWLILATLAHNLLRWVVAIGLGARTLTAAKTIRRRLLTLPGRITRSARRPQLHLPGGWPWAAEFQQTLSRLRALDHPA
jgi:tetratricopeptide (TPR) repeat protein